jgi:hypothetical protein
MIAHTNRRTTRWASGLVTVLLVTTVASGGALAADANGDAAAGDSTDLITIPGAACSQHAFHCLPPPHPPIAPLCADGACLKGMPACVGGACASADARASSSDRGGDASARATAYGLDAETVTA